MERAGKSIVLIGMMGAGKSSVGRCLQFRTGLNRLDTDELVSKKFGLSIPEIFSRDGEEAFRNGETQTLKEFSLMHPAIIVTGGGIILRPENVDLLKSLGFLVWLDGKEEVLFERATRRGGRPLLETEDPRARFAQIFKVRAPLYQNAADIRIDTTKRSHDDVAGIILSEIEKCSGIDG